ncbi:hypothetical protein DV495_002547 [Geotrichum candidum]|nr:hypothetical protein DV454_002665 [Geotrichum candidum]KAI9210582.1 hypothetical protein DS838_004526 [Geotrichum bryndzae]KAF5116636.1 hypothetical protein DV452_002589 [Geotrichum candidum]KAF5129122.1 hypothetical protein DV495_002547 [Geotrichum candidum]KAF7498485.1 hypothetical protein DV113_003479 [Geotrichum candidum]
MKFFIFLFESPALHEITSNTNIFYPSAQYTMSFNEYKDTISEGDIVLAWMTRTSTKPLVVTKDATFNTRYGHFPHDKMVGLPLGTQMASSSKAGFLHLLAPTPELWTMSLPHRTQIVYTPDSSYIVQRLRIRPGSRVLEAGTGSGSFTHAMSRTVGKTGQVFTYEFHEHRYKEALGEIRDHQLSNVTITHRDVCKNGFRLDPAAPEGEGRLDASAVFLDLPSPWLAIPNLKSVVSRERSTAICCFSPCIEQVTRTVEALKKEGWQHIEMVEVSAKKWEGHKEMVRSIDDAMERLRDVKRRRLSGLKKRNERIEKEKRGESAEDSAATADDETDAAEKSANTTENEASSAQNVKTKGFNPWGKGLRIKEGAEGYEWRDVSRVESEIKSHTSYLTFAVLPPPIPENLVDAQGNVLSSM